MSGDASGWIPWLPFITTTLIFVLGAFLQVWLVRYTFREQLRQKHSGRRKTFVTQSRIKWVEDARRLLADYLATAWAYSHIRQGSDGAEFYRLKSDVTRLFYEILLTLNPDEHTHIIDACRGVLDCVANGSATDLPGKTELLRNSVRVLLKAEWERAKNLE